MEKNQPANLCIDWRKRRATIAANVLPLYLERPWPGVSIEHIAERLGMTYWQVYYSFDGQEDIYRAAVAQLVDSLTDRITAMAKPSGTVTQTIRQYVRSSAEIVGTDAYRRLLFLRMRDEYTDPWIKEAFESLVAEPIRQGLESAIASAGDRCDLNLVLLHGARNQFLTMLDSAIALPKLLQHEDFVDRYFEQTIAAATRHILTATCTFDGFRMGGAQGPNSIAA